jgi:hypothetical protein
MPTQLTVETNALPEMSRPKTTEQIQEPSEPQPTKTVFKPQYSRTFFYLSVQV